MTGPPQNVVDTDALPHSIASVLATGWASTCDTAGAANDFPFTSTSIAARKNDLKEATYVLDRIEQARVNTSRLCRLLVETLPLELREMIYEYLVPWREATVVDSKNLKDRGRKNHDDELCARSVYFYPNPDPSKSSQDRQFRYTLPYEPSTEIVGSEVKQELQAYFYRHVRIHLGYIYPRIVSTLVEKGTFRLPLRKISVSFNAWDYDLPPVAHRKKRWDRQKVVLESLDELIAVPGNEVDLVLLHEGTSTDWFGEVPRSQINAGRVSAALELIFSRLAALREGGYKTSFAINVNRESYRRRGRMRREVRDFRYIFTPADENVTFEGCMEKVREHAERDRAQMQAEWAANREEWAARRAKGLPLF